MKQFIALFFLFIFTFQVLPARSMARYKVKYKQTAEVKGDSQDCDDDDAEKDSKGLQDDVYVHQPFWQHVHTVSKTTVSFSKRTLIHQAEQLPPSWSIDILCPPPNC